MSTVVASRVVRVARERQRLHPRFHGVAEATLRLERQRNVVVRPRQVVPVVLRLEDLQRSLCVAQRFRSIGSRFPCAMTP